MKTRRFEGLGGVRLAAEVGGDPADPSVILLHGAGQTRHSWKKATEALVARGNHVVSLDLRGHGESDWSKNGDYGFDSYVADLFAVVRLLRTKPTLIGASLGGLVSLLAVGEKGGNFRGASHMVAGDENDVFNAAVIGFLAQMPDQEKH